MVDSAGAFEETLVKPVVALGCLNDEYQEKKRNTGSGSQDFKTTFYQFHFLKLQLVSQNKMGKISKESCVLDACQGSLPK